MTAARISKFFLIVWAIVLLCWVEVHAMWLPRATTGGVLFGWAVVSLGYLLVVLGQMTGASRLASPLSAALSGLVPLAFGHGVDIAASLIFSIEAMEWMALGCFIAWVAIFEPWSPLPLELRKGSQAPQSALPSSVMVTLGTVLTACLLAGIIFSGRHVVREGLRLADDLSSTNLLYVPRGDAANDIRGQKFIHWNLIALPLFFFAMVSGVAWLTLVKNWWKPYWGFAVLVGLAIIGKWYTAGLSSQGLEVIGIKITSVNNNYYTLAKAIDSKGLYAYIRDFSQSLMILGAHGNTHPFLPEVFYWFISRVVGWNAQAVGLVYQAMAALVVIPVVRIASAAYANRKIGIAAGLLLLSSPLSLILSGAGIDAMVLLLMALCTWSFTRAALEGRVISAVAAGLWYFVGSLSSIGFNVFPVFGGLWVAAMAWRALQSPRRSLVRTVWIFSLAAVVVLGLHGLLYLATGSHFKYTEVMNQSRVYHQNINVFRMYGLWSWANVLLYMGYAGLGVMAAFAARSFSALWKLDRSDAYTLLALAFAWLLILSAMGRAEVERIFIFGALFLVVPAARWCGVPAAGPALELQGFSMGRLLWVCGINIITMTILQIFVLDFW